MCGVCTEAVAAVFRPLGTQVDQKAFKLASPKDGTVRLSSIFTKAASACLCWSAHLSMFGVDALEAIFAAVGMEYPMPKTSHPNAYSRSTIVRLFKGAECTRRCGVKIEASGAPPVDNP